jgi:hypothetical protein
LCKYVVNPRLPEVFCIVDPVNVSAVPSRVYIADANKDSASDAAAAARLAQRERAEELAVVQDWRALQHKG